MANADRIGTRMNQRGRATSQAGLAPHRTGSGRGSYATPLLAFGSGRRGPTPGSRGTCSTATAVDPAATARVFLSLTWSSLSAAVGSAWSPRYTTIKLAPPRRPRNHRRRPDGVSTVTRPLARRGRAGRATDRDRLAGDAGSSDDHRYRRLSQRRVSPCPQGGPSGLRWIHRSGSVNPPPDSRGRESGERSRGTGVGATRARGGWIGGDPLRVHASSGIRAGAELELSTGPPVSVRGPVGLADTEQDPRTFGSLPVA